MLQSSCLRRRGGSARERAGGKREASPLGEGLLALDVSIDGYGREVGIGDQIGDSELHAPLAARSKRMSRIPVAYAVISSPVKKQPDNLPNALRKCE